MKKKIVLKDAKRFLLFITSVVVLASLIIVFALNNRAYGYDEPKYDKVYVSEGETLWGIASETRKPGTDIRQYIYEIKLVNNLATSELFVGQELLIPQK